MTPPSSAATESVALAPPRPWAEREWAVLLGRLIRRRTALFGLAAVAIVILAALFAPALSPFDPLEQDISQRLKEPGWQDAQGRAHALGTDHPGRDILARIICRSRMAAIARLSASP